MTNCAACIMARDGKGFGNQAMTAVIEKKVDGVMLGASKQFFAGTLENMSRTITTQGQNGVVEWKKLNVSK